MSFLKEHPLGAVAIGIVIGLVFGSQLKRLPGLSSLPSK
jgi:ElaB/YqjD/DUF883 family membrane-anchored ribosome-binding protein